MVNTQQIAGSGGGNNTDGSLSVGTMLQERYRVISVLGVGGMGSVYLTRDIRFSAANRQVAIKEMLNQNPDPGLRELTQRTFEREANILAELSHPSIPKIFDYFTLRDPTGIQRAYLVMEYINGRDLEQIINSVIDPLPFNIIKEWAIELCEVLEYLHSHQPEPIIFRDMKPSNVMIDSQRHVRLIDFGIARTFGQGVNKGTMIGTEGYSPPEQYRGETAATADIYALGATFHHLTTRLDPRIEAPFSFYERPIRTLNQQIPEAFEKIIMKALEYHPQNRWQSVAQMREAILAAFPSGATVVVQDNAPTAGTYPAAGSGAGLSNGAAAVSAGADENSAQDALDDLIKPVWKFRCEEQIVGSPVHHKGIIYVGALDNNLWAINAADGELRWKFDCDGAIRTTPAISVEDNLICFGAEDGIFYAVDLRTGKISWTIQTPAPILSSPTVFSGHAFFGSDDGKLYAVRLQTGKVYWKVDAGSEVRSRPAVTNDRIVVGTEVGDTLGIDLAGNVKWRHKSKRAVYSSPAISEGVAFFGSMDQFIYGVDIANGWAVWRFRTQKPVAGSGTVVGNVLYMGSADGNLYALDVNQNGRELWHFSTEAQIVSTPAAGAGVIYFGCSNGKIYCLDMKKGKLRWSFATEKAITSSACLVDKLLYIGSTDRYLYAINA